LALDLSLCTLALARCLPLGLLMPLFAREVPRAISLSLWLALSALLYGFSGPVEALHGYALWKAALSELGIGTIFGAACAAPFVAIAWTGQLSQASLLLRSPAESGPVTTLFRLAALNLFFMLGGQRALCAALISSLEDVPLGLSRFGAEPFLGSVAQLMVDVCATMLAFGLPLVLTLWIVDFGMALVARASGHNQYVAAKAPARFVAGVLVLALSFTPVIDAFPGAVRDAMQSARSLIRALAG